jgi:hypoxanthine phosphoribosyltransferase
MKGSRAVAASREPTLRYVSHEEFVEDVEAVGRALESDGWRPTFLVGIGRGGLVPAAYISHLADIPMLSVDHSSKVFGFGDELLGKVCDLLVDDHRILFIDDINDSGSTISYIRNAVASRCPDGARLRFAVLIDNIRSVAQVEYRSRTIDRSIEKDWFVFPWEAVARREAVIREAEAVPARLA